VAVMVVALRCGGALRFVAAAARESELGERARRAS